MRGDGSRPRLRTMRSEASKCELRERREREEERRQEAKGPGAEVEGELPLFLPTPSFMATAEEARAAFLGLSLCLSFLLSPLLFRWCVLPFLGQGRRAKGSRTADRKRTVCNSP